MEIFGLFGLFGLILIMWLMIILVSLALITIVAPLHLFIFHNTTDRYITSAIQAILAVGIVIVLVLILSKMKSYYLRRKLDIR